MIVNLNLCNLHSSYFIEKYTNLDIYSIKYRFIKCDVKNCFKYAYNKVSVDLNSENKKISDNITYLNVDIIDSKSNLNINKQNKKLIKHFFRRF
jgi:hypothetical protein